jgi:cysteine desulfurase
LSTVYLDHNATTKPRPEVVEEMLPCLRDGFGNPSALYAIGRRARSVLDRARERVAALIGAQPEEIVFTSGGTEADNQALCSATSGPRTGLIVSAIEHQAILATARSLERRGSSLKLATVDHDGVVLVDQLEKLLEPGTALVSVMLANNDVGSLQPIPEIAALAHAHGALAHSDAVQGLGKTRLDVRALGVDLLSVSSHKIGGPKGAGALFIRKGLELPPLLRGGHQERLRRAGTENVPAIAGFGKACELAARELDSRIARMRLLRDRLEAGIRARFPTALIHGHPERRLPNTLNVSFPGAEGEILQMTLDAMGIAVSTGSACQSGLNEPSHVLMAMGCSKEESLSALRFSVGDENTEEEIDRALEALQVAVGGKR